MIIIIVIIPLILGINQSTNGPDPCGTASGGGGAIGARGGGAPCALGDLLLLAANRVPLPLPLEPSCARGKDGVLGKEGRDR